MDVKLRRATAADAAAVARVYCASWNEGFAELMPAQVLDSDQVARWERDLAEGGSRWWVAHCGDQLVGFVGSGPSRDPIGPLLGELDTIAVAPPAWRHGVGARLMDAALDDLLAAGYREAIVWTLANYEQGSAFYEATGWHPTGEARDSGREIAYRRSLAAPVDPAG